MCLKLVTSKMCMFVYGNDRHFWCKLGADRLNSCPQISDRVRSLPSASLACRDLYDERKV
jgi:hypothetical protein